MRKIGPGGTRASQGEIALTPPPPGFLGTGVGLQDLAVRFDRSRIVLRRLKPPGLSQGGTCITASDVADSEYGNPDRTGSPLGSVLPGHILIFEFHDE